MSKNIQNDKSRKKRQQQNNYGLQTSELPECIARLYEAQCAVKSHYESSGLKFTLDGRLVGDIAEAIAMEWFDLVQCLKRTKGVDALCRDGKTVQVKATGSAKKGPAFSPGEGAADFLLFFHIDFVRCDVRVIYNGPERPVRALLPKNWSGTKRALLDDVVRLNKAVPARKRLRRNYT